MGDIIYAIPAILSVDGGILNIAKKPHYDILNSLLNIQPNIEAKYGWDGINLDLFRIKNDNKKHLSQCHAEVLNTSIDLTKKWLFNIDSIKEFDIVVNVTRHYHDKKEIDYKILQGYEDKILFIGNEDEYKVFKKQFLPNLKNYKHCQDALEIAKIIAGSKIFIGNQSLCFSLAEALKVPRALEICYAFNNCRPSGLDWWTSLSKEIIDKCLYI